MKNLKRFIPNTLFILVISVLNLNLTGCSSFNNFMLGKDNTPTPAELIEFKPELTIDTEWDSNAGSGSDGSYLEMAPFVDSDTIYTADIKGRVMAFNRKTGKKEWETDLKTSLISGPSVGGNYLVVTDQDAKLFVLDASTGKKIWRRTVSNEIFAPPTVAEGKVFVKTVDGKLYAFDEQDGKLSWMYDHGTTPLVMRAGSSPQALFGIVIVGFSDSKLIGLRADTGQLLWEKTISTPNGVSDVERMADIDANPIIMDSVAYVAAYQQNISAMSLQSGDFLWQKKGISTFNNMVADSSTLYVVDDESIIWAINRESGTVLWQQKDLHNRRLTAPAIMENKALVVGDYAGYVQWLSLTDGHIIGRSRSSSSSIYAQPAVDNDTVYVLTSYGTLVAYRTT